MKNEPFSQSKSDLRGDNEQRKKSLEKETEKKNNLTMNTFLKNERKKQISQNDEKQIWVQLIEYEAHMKAFFCRISKGISEFALKNPGKTKYK